jgi:hypothetical protein
MNQFVSSLQFVASSSTNSSESVRQFVAPYIETGTTTNTQGLPAVPKDSSSSLRARPFVTASTPEQTAAYVAGLCIDCRTVRYSAGRPRCNACHAAYAAALIPVAEDLKSGVGNPTTEAGS